MPRKERERRYVAEYMLATWPEGDWELNVPVGNVPVELVQVHGLSQAAALWRPSRRRVDAVVWRPERYLIIETKIRDPFEGIGRLQTYLVEARETPDLPGYTGQEIGARLVVPFVIDRDSRAAATAGIELVEWSQPWIEEYIQERQNYFTAEYRARRNEVQRMRELLGLE